MPPSDGLSPATAQFSVGGSATIAIDGSSLKLASPWAVEPQSGAGYEVDTFSGVELPSVRVKVYAQATPSVVVFEPAGGTAVTQGGTPAPVQVQVRLSSAPLPALLDSFGNYSVTIDYNDTYGNLTLLSAQPSNPGGGFLARVANLQPTG